MSSLITSLRLTNFRNIPHLRLDFTSRISFISGNNGLGKTNLLDALSRMNTIRGLKNQLSRECVNVLKPNYGWGAGVSLDNGDIIQYGRTTQNDKMIYHYNHTPINHDDMRQKVPILWLSPVGEKLFTEEHKYIRGYIDNLISMIFPALSHYRSDYDKALKQRLKLLQENGDPQWITALEFEIAKNACHIIHLRQSFLVLFKQSYDLIIGDTLNGFPAFSLNIACDSHAFTTIDHYQNKLSNMRHQDTVSGRSLFGIHRNKINVMHDTKKIDIYYCSTGEQKAILSHILFVMNHIVQSKNYAAPIMLFDDALAHYDAKRIDFFYHYMQYNSHNQFFLTNTDFPKDITLYQDITLYDLGKLLNNDSQLLF